MVNGPGFRWVRDLVMNQPGAEIATTTLSDSPAQAHDGAAPVEEIPSTPIPPLVVASTTPEASPAAPRPKAPEPPRSAEPREKAVGALEPREFSLDPLPSAQPPAAAIPVASAPSPALEPPAPLATSKDRDGATARERERETDRPRIEPREPAPPPSSSPVDPNVTLAAMSTESPRAPSPLPSPAIPEGARGADDWGTIRRKLHALGVARYGIEGEPNGRVRFHCVIPLAGRRAVGQQFEAEGADEIEAAQTALRRVALWRATEAPNP